MKKLTLALLCGSFIFSVSSPSYGMIRKKLSRAVKTTVRRSSGVENRFLEKTSIERNSANAQWMDTHPLSFLEVKTDPKTNQVVGVTPMRSKKGKENGSVEFQQTKAQGMVLDQLAVEKSQLFQVPIIYEHEMKNTEEWLKQGSALYGTRKALLGLGDPNAEALLERHAVLQFGSDFLGQHPGAKLSKLSGGHYAELQDGKYIQFLNWIQKYGVTHGDVKHYLTTGEMRNTGKTSMTSSSAVTSPQTVTKLKRNSGSQGSLESYHSCNPYFTDLQDELARIQRKTPPTSPRLDREELHHSTSRLSIKSGESGATGSNPSSPRNSQDQVAVRTNTPPTSPRGRVSRSSSEQDLGEAAPQPIAVSNNGWVNLSDGMGWRAPAELQKQWVDAAALRGLKGQK